MVNEVEYGVITISVDLGFSKGHTRCLAYMEQFMDELISAPGGHSNPYPDIPGQDDAFGTCSPIRKIFDNARTKGTTHTLSPTTVRRMEYVRRILRTVREKYVDVVHLAHLDYVFVQYGNRTDSDTLIRPKRQLGLMIAAIGSFVIGSVATNFGVKAAVAAVASNQKRIESQIASGQTKIIHMEGIMHDWAKQLDRLGSLHMKLIRHDVSQDIQEELDAISIQLLHDKDFLDALLDTLLDLNHVHKSLFKFLDREVLANALIELQKQASVQGLTTDPDLKYSGNLVNYDMTAMIDPVSKRLVIAIHVPLYTPKSTFAIYRFIPTPFRLKDENEKPTQWVVQVNPEDTRYLAINEESNRLEFTQQEYDECPIIFNRKHCNFDTFLQPSYTTCLYSLYLSTTHKEKVLGCRTTAVSKMAYSMKLTEEDWVIVDTTSQNLRLTCEAKVGHESKTNMTNLPMADGWMKVKMPQGCSATTSALKVVNKKQRASYNASMEITSIIALNFTVDRLVSMPIAELTKINQEFKRIGNDLEHEMDVTMPSVHLMDPTALLDFTDVATYVLVALVSLLTGIYVFIRCRNALCRHKSRSPSRATTRTRDTSGTYRSNEIELDEVGPIDPEVNPRVPRAGTGSVPNLAASSAPSDRPSISSPNRLSAQIRGVFSR